MKSLCFSAGSDSKESTCNAGDLGSIPGSGRPPGGGHGNPLQDSCLENPTDRGAWWATVHGVTENRTKRLSTAQHKHPQPFGLAASHTGSLMVSFPFPAEGSCSSPIMTQESHPATSSSFSMDVFRRIMFFITLLINHFNF